MSKELREEEEKREGKWVNGLPTFRKEVIVLDDYTFKLDMGGKIIKLSTPCGRTSECCSSKY